MSHNHHHPASKNIKIAFFLNVSFTIVELIGGLLTNSVAIMSDALHDFGDSISLWWAWFLENYARKKRTNTFSYGYKRFSLLGAFINAVILFVGSLFILSEALPRLFAPQDANAEGMLLLAIFGIIMNGIAVYKTAKGRTMNEKVVSLHLLEDVLGWIAVFLVSIIMMLTDLPILDPLLSILITCYILRWVIKNLKATTLLFLQATPSNLDINHVENILKNQSSIQDVHDTHVWSLDGETHILSTHIVIKKDASKKDIQTIKQQSKQALKKIGIRHSTLELEFEDEQCQGNCEKQE